jgi:predicted enzyme related to lactoylglutathione lyase
MMRVVHFEIPADDPGRAVGFYRSVFGWQIDNWGGPMDYWLASTGSGDEPGIDGAILRRNGNEPVRITIQVPSVDQFVELIARAGGRLLIPKATIPGVGYHALCADTEGNIFGIMEEDTRAGMTDKQKD